MSNNLTGEDILDERGLFNLDSLLCFLAKKKDVNKGVTYKASFYWNISISKSVDKRGNKLKNKT
jgi:hypothetical protein